MRELDRIDPSDQTPWRQYRKGAAMPARVNLSEAADSLRLAAYLDGTLEERERAELEAWLAAHPEALEVLLASREALAEATGPAPDSLVRRACALVPERRAPLAGQWRRLGRRLRRRLGDLVVASAWRGQALAWSGVTAAVLVACLAGFRLGESGYHSAATVENLLAHETAAVFGESGEELI
jgi:anti-sigma factor RsiW